MHRFNLLAKLKIICHSIYTHYRHHVVFLYLLVEERYKLTSNMLLDIGCDFDVRF